jgi:hypothetical protein
MAGMRTKSADPDHAAFKDHAVELARRQSSHSVW